METNIGDLNTDTRTIPVTFTQGDIVHSRSVNACYDADGEYDANATRERVDQVGQGVARKIALGVIVKDEPAPAPEAEAEEAPHAE